jgi:hypothetical protein
LDYNNINDNQIILIKKELDWLHILNYEFEK